MKEEEERIAKEAKEKEEAQMKNDEQQKAAEEGAAAEGEKPEDAEAPKEGDQQIEDKPATESKSQPKKRIKRSSSIKEPKQPEEDDLRNIGYFPRPRGNEFLWNFQLAEGVVDDEQQKKVTSITSGGNYSYAMVKSKNEVYSWGFGENYILGNRQDENEYKPYKLDPRMFEEKNVVQIACGTQHVVALIQESPETEMAAVDFSSFVKVASKVPAKEPKPEPAEGEEADDDEDLIQLPEFAKSMSLKSAMSFKEKNNLP